MFGVKYIKKQCDMNEECQSDDNTHIDVSLIDIDTSYFESSVSGLIPEDYSQMSTLRMIEIEMIRIAEDYTPNSYYEDIPIDASEWIFGGELKYVSHRHKLPNFRNGYTSSIDNCYGEFLNYHGICIPKLIELVLRDKYEDIDISLIEDEWIKDSSTTFDVNSVIRYRIRHDNREITLYILRIDSTNSRLYRPYEYNLGRFLMNLVLKVDDLIQ